MWKQGQSAAGIPPQAQKAQGAKMCGGVRAGGIQFISFAGKGALTNGQRQMTAHGKIQNLFHAICVSLALVCRLVWMVSLVSFGFIWCYCQFDMWNMPVMARGEGRMTE